MLLHAVGVDASFFDSIAVLIAVVTLSQLPVGPSVGAAAAVLILGSDGVAATAAAGRADDRDRHRGRLGVPRLGRASTACFTGRRIAVAPTPRATIARRRPPSRERAERRYTGRRLRL